MGHRRGRRRRSRRRSPHRPRRPPLTETYRPVASRVRANVRARIRQENTPAGEDRPVRNPLSVYVMRMRWWWFLLEKGADGPGDSSRERSFGQDAVVIGRGERGREIEGKGRDRYGD